MMPICEQSTSSCEIKLRELEIDSYSKILSVFRARGNLSNERRKLLKQIGSFLNISRERHRAEIRRVTNDELLSTIATRLTGQDWTVDWNEEGKRLVPTGTPFSNFTVNTPFADYIASVASLGKKYVELYNQRVCNSVPNVNKTIENVKSTSDVSTDNWTEDVSKLFSSVQKDKYKDVSIQTTKIKVLPRKCTYCERRKKKRLESKKAAAVQEQTKSIKKPGDSYGEESSEVEPENSILLPSGTRIIVENAFDNSEDLSVSVIAQEIVVETEPIAGSSQSIDSSEMTSSVSPMSVNLTTPDFSGLNVDPSNLMPRDYLDPSFQHLFPKMWENVEQQPDPPRIPRILNSATRKKSRKQSLHPVNYSTPTQERGSKKKEDIEYYRESYTSRENCAASSFGPVRFNRPPNPPLPPRYKHELNKNPSKPSSRTSENVFRYHLEQDTQIQPSNKSYENLMKRQVGVLRHESLKTSKQRDPIKKHYDVQKHRDNISLPNEVIFKSHEMPKYQDVVARRTDNSMKPMGGIYKHYVRVRHTPKSKGYSEMPYHQTQYLSSSSQQVSETIEIPIEYIDSEPSSNNSSIEVVDVNDVRVTTAGLSSVDREVVEDEDDGSVSQSADFYHTPTSGDTVSSDFPASAEIPISTSHSSNNNYEGMILTDRNDPAQKKVIKLYNGEKKTQKSVYSQSDNVKEVMNSIEASLSGVRNGCQPEDNTSIVQTHTIWDGSSLSEGEFIMEDVSIIENSYPVINGHEEIVVEEEVIPGGEIIEGIVNKSGVCVIPQTDMKFSVMDISDYADSIETIHSVSSQSKDDSRDSDIIMN